MWTRLALASAVCCTATACTMKNQEAPPLAGPSEFGQSVTVSVSPDIISQDGASQSLVTVLALDPAAQPIRNLTLRAEIRVGGLAVDFGALSARNVVTGADGRATFVYTAPPAPSMAVDNFTVVDIFVWPIGTNFDNSAPRLASIRLVPPGIVIPPDGLVASFTMTPSSPLEDQLIVFSAQASLGDIASWEWNFGDGATASGETVSHAYDDPGTYAVTLRISDSFGRSRNSTQSVTVEPTTAPTAAFVFSPTAPARNQEINFNASASTAGPGRHIVRYTWDFGDGSPLRTTSGPTTSYTYTNARTYQVTLVVTDDNGRSSLGTTVTLPITP